ncbi:MAG: hypothetical protein EOP45_10325 [Sphingobacteriaceae bacterium]|nr:MAG: hypothetical protein EOP45_10325 [Sphingobacteriaceae bacterium]
MLFPPMAVCKPKLVLLHPLFQKYHRDWKEVYEKNQYFANYHTDYHADELEQTKLKLIRYLGKRELFYQNNLSKMFGMSHEQLSNGWVTDLSNEDLLIEIKNVKQFRQAIGQISQYSTFRPNAKRIVCLFGNLPSQETMQANVEVCERLDIELVWVWSEEIYMWMKKDAIL